MSESDPVRDPVADSSEDLLDRIAKGDKVARDTLFRQVYYDLRREAETVLRGQPRDHSMWATGLVHEVYLKLFGKTRVQWHDRRHFMAVAALAMRSVVVDHARAKRRLKRSAPGSQVGLDGLLDTYEQRFTDKRLDMIQLDEALHDFQDEYPEHYEVVLYRVYLHQPMPRIAELMDRPLRTVERQWAFAKAWLRKRME